MDELFKRVDKSTADKYRQSFSLTLTASYYAVAGGAGFKQKHTVVIVMRKILSDQLNCRERLVPKSLLSIKGCHTAEKFPWIRWIAEYCKHFKMIFL
ncbi:MAG: hypothetical protein ACYS9C_10520 [Planctomycetota bacterium]